jgi:hypothetical protein
MKINFPNRKSREARLNRMKNDEIFMVISFSESASRTFLFLNVGYSHTVSSGEIYLLLRKFSRYVINRIMALSGREREKDSFCEFFLFQK